MVTIEVDGIEYRLHNPTYAVSRCGKVLRKGVPYSPKTANSGYLYCGHHLVHRMVAACWLDSYEPHKHVHHINHDRLDNRVENLESLTQQEHLRERHGDHMAKLGYYVRTAATKEKIRQFRTGKKTSEETKAKQRAALVGKKRPYFARAGHSAESRLARSFSHVRNTTCRIDGVEYRSFAEAARVTGVHRFTIRKRCLSKNFPNYELVQPNPEVSVSLPTP